MGGKNRQNLDAMLEIGLTVGKGQEEGKGEIVFKNI